MSRASLARRQEMQLYKTNTRPHYNLQKRELWWDNQCMIYSGQYVHLNYKILNYKKLNYKKDKNVKYSVVTSACIKWV